MQHDNWGSRLKVLVKQNIILKTSSNSALVVMPKEHWTP